MILKTAWKNVWRNKTRSLVVIASITIGIFAGVFAVGLMNGTMEQRIEAALDLEISHIQINKPGFRDNYDLDLTLDNYEKLNNELKEIPEIESVANRMIITAIANTANKSTGIQLIGVNPEEERDVFSLDQQIIPGTGTFFSEESRYNQVVIGQDLAKELNVIRYRIEKTVLDSLAAMGMPENLIVKLKPLTGKRFSGEKMFTKEIKASLPPMAYQKWGQKINDLAWSFRQRSRITITFVDKDNVMTGAVFRVTGVYDVKNSMFEKTEVFALNKDLHNLTGLADDAYHLTVARIRDRDQTDAVAEQLRDEYPKLEIQSWKQLSPDLAMMTAMIEKFNAVFMVIILAALSFGIVNTMLMVVLERTRELGMLTAIGMNKKRVFTMIMSESVFLSLVGGVTGMALSRMILLITAKKGINFSSAAEGFEAMGFSAHIYPTISNSFFITVTILIILTGIISSVYPAIKALKLDPAEALRQE